MNYYNAFIDITIYELFFYGALERPDFNTKLLNIMFSCTQSEESANYSISIVTEVRSVLCCSCVICHWSYPSL